MKDIRTQFLKKIYKDLQGVGIPVYSVIPNNEPNPFIYIGDITSGEIANKSQFHTSGTVTVEMFTGTEVYVGSLIEPLSYYNSIKWILKPTKNYTPALYGFNISTWNLDADSGLQQFSSTERMFVGTLLYNFTSTEHQGYIDRVESNGGTITSIDCIPMIIR